MGPCHLSMFLFNKPSYTSIKGWSPLKLWSYLALGKPVIFFDAGVMGHSSEIPGILHVTDDDPEMIAEFIIKCWRCLGPKGLKEIGMKGRQYILKNATWEKHVSIINAAIIKSLSPHSG